MKEKKKKLGLGSLWRSFFTPSRSSTKNTSSLSTSDNYSNHIEVSGSSSSRDAVGEVIDHHEETPSAKISGTPSLKEFSFTDLKTATSNFRLDSLLGSGAFGDFYKGWIDDKTLAPSETGTGMAVAIKILYPGSIQTFDQWQLEVNILGRCYHPNIIELLGYCWEDERRILVYEFMQMGSLQDHLFKSNVIEPLSWDTRLKISIGTARGLAFLHTLQKEVLHRDFKLSTILLDTNYNPKLSNFSLAKLRPSGDKSHVTTKFIHNFGYSAPEYLAQGHLHVKSDVYSFGVVLLQLLTGLRVIDPTRPMGQHHLVQWLKPYLSEKNKVRYIMDVQMEGQYSFGVASQAMQLTLKCLETNPRDRPSTKEVLEALEQIKAMKNK